MAGFVVVTKGTSKKVVAAAVKSINFHCDVLFAKAEAAEWGLHVAKTAELSYVSIELDCLEVVELVNDKKCSRTEIFWLISDIYSSNRQD